MKTIFVSSTFKDMQFERDCLNTQVLPTVNEIAKKYGDSVALCDLRWGINTYGMSADQSDKKILNACLHEIDNCRPYMIVFLGERYGWVPGKRLLKRAIDDYAQLDLPDYDISVTALEIEYGAFLDPEQVSRTLFYFRENADGLTENYSEADALLRDKLTALKDRIKSIKGAHVHTYSLNFGTDREKPERLDELAEKIICDVSSLMLGEWEKFARLTEYEKEKQIQWAHAEKNAEVFYERYTKLSLCKYLLDKYLPFFFIVDSDGTGKTSLLSKIACDRRQEGIRVLPVFCGLTPLSSNLNGIVKYVINYLKEAFGDIFARFDTEVEGDTNYWREQFAAAMETCGRLEEKIELYFDEVNLLCADSVIDLPFFIKDLPENVSLVFSCESRRGLPENCLYVYGISSPDYFDTKHVMERQLKGTRKELDDEVLQEIFYKKGSLSPLYLKVILQRLALLNRTDFEQIAEKGGDITAIIDYQKQMIRGCSHSLGETCAQLVAAVCERINPTLGKCVADYIFASYDGVSEDWLRLLAESRDVKWIPLDFRIIMQFLEGLVFLRDNGKYDLVYGSIKSSFKVDGRVYPDLMRLIEGQKSLTDGDAAAYAYYCLRSENHGAYLNFILSHPQKWKVIADVTFNTLQYKFHYEMKSTRLEQFLKRWISNLLSDARQFDAFEALEEFIRNDYNGACLKNVYFWRVMAIEVYGDWETVNKIQRGAEESDGTLSEKNYDDFQQLLADWKNLQKNTPVAIRREHLIADKFREHEFEIAGRKFYFFNVPRADDSQLFFMRDDCVLLSFFRSSVSDHCTYDVAYNETDGSLTVTESDFDHYEVESDVSIYRFNDPLSADAQYELTRDTRRGAYNLPLHFVIKRT